jgi:lipoate-protein ligase B
MIMPRRNVKRHTCTCGRALSGLAAANRPMTAACYRRPVQTDAMPTSREDGAARSGEIGAAWLGRVPYREAWALQKQLAARRADGSIGDRLLLLEHPRVLTLGRHADEGHVLADADELRRRGIEVIRVERGGEVTYHGPGQLVAYPILRLADRGILLRPLVRALEAAMAETCAAFGVGAGRREGHPGCWCEADGAAPRKVGALGIRVERGVSYHGIALNVDPDLADFDLIDPCGVPGLVSTSMAAELRRAGADDAAATDSDAVARAASIFAASLARELGVGLAWESPRPMAATA